LDVLVRIRRVHLERDRGKITYVEREGETDHDQVEAVHEPVLGQPVVHQLGFNQVHKVNVEEAIDDQKKTLLNTVPDPVGSDEGLTDLQAGWDPNAKHADVDYTDGYSDDPFESVGFVGVVHNQTDSVGHDLH